MKYQILFSGKNKKNLSKCHLLKILPRMLSVKQASGKKCMSVAQIGNWHLMNHRRQFA